MRPMNLVAIIVSLALLYSLPDTSVNAAPLQNHLVLVGGGTIPERAIDRFVEWAGKGEARILVIPWATSEPQDTVEYLTKKFSPYHPQAIEAAPFAPLTADTKVKFLTQLKSATGVFFGGGDQVRIMNVLKDKEILNVLRDQYHDGVVFGGTSAGTAIMSERMITGEGDFTVIDAKKVETIEGLGLLPEFMIVDQHFIKRQRENRLFGLILNDPRSLGIGIDESAEVAGTGKVMLVDARQLTGALVVRIFDPEAKIDLLKGTLKGDSSHNTP